MTVYYPLKWDSDAYGLSIYINVSPYTGDKVYRYLGGLDRLLKDDLYFIEQYDAFKVKSD